MPARQRSPALGLGPALGRAMTEPAARSPRQPAQDLAPGDAVRLLRDGALEIEGRLADASNTTLYCTVTLDGVTAVCVHKPVAGERPLWDFPDGTLAGREVAAYLVSEAIGWEIVPPTVLRDGPLGPGMCQLWIEPDPKAELFEVFPADAELTGWIPVVRAVAEGEPAVLAHRDDPRLRRVAVFDAVVNNADRKGGHLLPTPSGHVYGVDHGVCFSVDDKLRTLLWGWRGQPLPDDALDALARLAHDLDSDLGERLSEHLTAEEIAKTAERVRRLLDTGVHPEPSPDWPAVPWPPF
ncbi:phosphatidylinositol kinase [Carbonactinospora thermoautotrophica]|uniref:Phosphatidylinositol kinase n=2 Tax=Carbonactinospora thermoautotrophica TaxID=1469144 RepID=A0A132N860_9ACTN|nr:phosphatidylinositol kinase [Carbonactinospora thermoautotrophica]